MAKGPTGPQGDRVSFLHVPISSVLFARGDLDCSIICFPYKPRVLLENKDREESQVTLDTL